MISKGYNLDSFNFVKIDIEEEEVITAFDEAGNEPIKIFPNPSKSGFSTQ